MPVATNEKKGLMSAELYKKCVFIKVTQGNGGVTKLYKVAHANAYSLLDIYVLTDIGRYIAYRVISSGNILFAPNIEKIGNAGVSIVSNLNFYKNNVGEVYMLVITANYGISIFSTDCLSSYGVAPILEVQPSADVSALTEIPIILT